MIISWNSQVKRHVILSFSLLLFFISSLGLYHIYTAEKQAPLITPQNTNQVLGTTDQSQAYGLPLRLSIPSISVHANIQYLGVSPNDEMEVPDNENDVGWFKLGPRPGEIGSAVIAGHLDGKNDESGVFSNLHKLKKGDLLSIENDKNQSLTFIVTDIRKLNPGFADEVFISSDSAHLNLVTCGGIWQEDKKSYSKRLVVFSDILP